MKCPKCRKKENVEKQNLRSLLDSIVFNCFGMRMYICMFCMGWVGVCVPNHLKSVYQLEFRRLYFQFSPELPIDIDFSKCM